MELIIDIPDNDYKNIKEYYEKNDTVEGIYSYIYYGIPLPKGQGRLIERVLNAAETLKQKTGQWILDETDNSITCNKCGCLMWASDLCHGDAHYCPNCGAKMESEERNERKTIQKGFKETD